MADRSKVNAIDKPMVRFVKGEPSWKGTRNLPKHKRKLQVYSTLEKVFDPKGKVCILLKVFSPLRVPPLDH